MNVTLRINPFVFGVSRGQRVASSTQGHEICEARGRQDGHDRDEAYSRNGVTRNFTAQGYSGRGDRTAGNASLYICQ
jgi:hypothetical protein